MSEILDVLIRNREIFYPAIIGFVVAIVLGVLIRILLGMRLKLYLIGHEFNDLEEAIIPITSEAKKSSLTKSLLKGNWREDVHLTLGDYSGKNYEYRIGYQLWRRFYVEPAGENTGYLNKTKMMPGRKHYLRTGMELIIGDRKFEILVTPSTLTNDLKHELFGST